MLENREKYEYLVRARIKQYEILNEMMKKESYKYYTAKKINKFQKYILKIIGIKILFEEQPEEQPEVCEDIEIKEVPLYK